MLEAILSGTTGLQHLPYARMMKLISSPQFAYAFIVHASRMVLQSLKFR